jgi:hypothetical protein
MQHRGLFSRAHCFHVAAVALWVGALACSASGDESSASPSGSRRGTTTPPASGQGAGSSGSPTLQLDGPSATPEPSQPETCEGESYEGKRVPVDMYFLVDSSGSMAEAVGGGTKWQVVSNALISFLNGSPNMDGAVGIGYFPTGGISACTMGQPGCVCIPYTPICVSNTGGSCTPADYKPAAPLSLPANTAVVVGHLRTHQLSGGTPTRPALEGTMPYLEQWASSHPQRKVVLVLATDGEPTGCDRNQPQDIASVAAKGWTGPHAIRTFVIGVGSSLGALDVVAQAGGTERALLVDTSVNLGAQFTEALEKIRNESTVACDFAIPAAATGAAIDTAKVNVRVAAAGSAPSLVSQTFMSDPANCGANGGWYYDNPSSPTRIQLCDATCKTLQSGKVQIEYGCDTVVSPPR